MSTIVNITISCQTQEAAEYNLEGAKFRHEIYKKLNVPEVVIAQEFTDEYAERYKREVGVHEIVRHPKRLGYVGARNAAFQYLYESDFDYAILNDSRDVLGKTSVLEFEDLLRCRMSDEVQLPEFISMRNPTTPVPTKYTNELELDKNFVPIKRLDKLNQAMSTSFLHFAIFPNLNKKFGRKFFIPDTLVQYVNGAEDCLVLWKFAKFQRSLWVASSIRQGSIQGKNVSMHNAVHGKIDPKFYVSKMNYGHFETENFDLDVVDRTKSTVLVPRINRQDEYIENYHKKYVKSDDFLF